MPDDRVRIFVSSPADVGHERALVKDLTERLAQEYLPYFKLQAILWEEEALTADRTFQAGLTQPEDCEIVLVILWTRLGSPLPEEPYRGMTGTEWEFVNAVEAAARHGRPEVLVYKKTAPKLVDITDADSAEEAVADRHRLEAFFRVNFFNDDNTFRRAFRTFDSDTAFRELVEVQLRKLLNRRISVERRFASGELRWHGSPFRPDRPFEVADERVFTGREQEVRDLLARLQTRGQDGRGLVLLSGPSGAGKTSLLRAALLPRLGLPFQFNETAAVRTGLLDPGASATTPLAALAARLCDTDMLGPALARFGLDAGGLERLFQGDPALAARQIEGALGAAQGAASGGVRLVLVIDPLEACWEEGPRAGGRGPRGTETSIEAASWEEGPGAGGRGPRGEETATEAGSPTADPALIAPRPSPLGQFAAALRALIGSGAVWVVAALRSDGLPGLAALVPLHDLLGADAVLPLEPPPASRLRQIIEIPARVAGIELVSSASGQGPGLVDLLEAEVAQLRLWTPPLQVLLDTSLDAAATANQRNDHGELLLSAEHYRASGGLDGAVLAKAETVWQALDPAARAALPRLCRGLIALDQDSRDGPTARVGDLTVLRADPHCARLLDALIAARLVVAEGVRDAAAAKQCEPIDYRLGAAVASAWRQGRAEWRLRLRRRTLATADRAKVTQAPAEPTPASAASAATQLAKAHWLDIRPVVSLAHPALLTGFAPVRAWLAEPANREAVALRFQLNRLARLWKRTDCNRDYLLRETPQTGLARFTRDHAAEMEPLEQAFLDASLAQLKFLRRRSALVRATGLLLAVLFVIASITAGLAWQASDTARVNLNRSRLKEADLYIARGNTPQAVMLALIAGPDLPERGVRTLSQAFGNNRLIAMADLGEAPATVSRGPLPLASAQQQPGLDADGTLLATLLPDGTARLWRLESDRFVPERNLGGAGLGLHTLVIDASKRVYGISASGVWRLPASAGSPPLYPCGAPRAPVFALDDARRLLALGHPAASADADDGVCVLELDSPGRLRLDLPVPDGDLRSLEFAPDGRTLLTATSGGRAQVFDIAQGKQSLALPAEGPIGRPFTQAVFDADGKRIAVAATDERIRLFRRDGTPIAGLEFSNVGGRRIKMHNSAVRALAFDPSGLFLVSADDEGQVVRWSLKDLAGDDSAPAVNIGSHDLSINAVAIINPPPETANENLVLTSSLDHTARLWGLESGRGFGVLGHDGPLTSAAFCAGGRRVGSWSARDGSVRLWSVQPVSRLAYRFEHPDHVWSVAASAAPAALAPDGAALLLATAAFDGGVRLWRYDRDQPLAAPRRLPDLPAHQGRARRVAFSADGGRLASAGFDGAALVNDLIRGTGCRAQVTSAPDGRVFQVLFDPAGHWLLTTSNDPQAPVRAFDPSDCHALGTGTTLAHDLLPPPPPADGRTRARDRAPASAPVQAAALLRLAGYTLIATGDNAGWVHLVEVDDAGRWTPRCALPTAAGAINAVAISPDGSRIGVAGSASNAVLVDIAAAGCAVVGSLIGHSDLIYTITFAPDGLNLLTASLDKTARLWNRDGSPRAVFIGHQDRVYTAAFSPDGHWVLTASRDGSMRLWQRPLTAPTLEVEEVRDFLPLPAHMGGVADAVFSPDGNYVLGAYWENAALGWRIWNAAAPEPERIRRWGPVRARLSVIDEAYRFAHANRVTGEVESGLAEDD